MDVVKYVSGNIVRIVSCLVQVLLIHAVILLRVPEQLRITKGEANFIVMT